MVQFDHYTGATMHDGAGPITPICWSWASPGGPGSLLQLLKRAWAVTIHKSQGLTLDKVVIDVWKEFPCGLAFVSCSIVKKLNDFLFVRPFPLQRLSSISRSHRLHERKEDQQLPSQEVPLLEDILIHNEEEESMKVHVAVRMPSTPVHDSGGRYINILLIQTIFCYRFVSVSKF